MMKFFKILLIFLLFLQNTCIAMPNPNSWEELAKSAKIKTFAKVIKIKSKNKNGPIVNKEVTFKSDEGIFTGNCMSINKKLFMRHPVIGGVYINPQKGETVYVTITENNGQITTYQPLKPEDINKFKLYPQKIRYIWGKAYIEE